MGRRRDTGSGRGHRGGAATRPCESQKGAVALPAARTTSFVDGGPVAVLHVRDAGHGRDERCGELRDVVYHEVRRPLLDDREQVVRARLQLDPDEELREDEGADLRRMEARQRRPRARRASDSAESIASPTRNAVKPSASASPTTGSPDKRHVVSGFRQGAREWQHRPVVTCQRPAGQERAHRTRLPWPFPSVPRGRLASAGPGASCYSRRPGVVAHPRSSTVAAWSSSTSVT